MLEPSNRTLYTEALIPPAKMRLDFAVGTAYSLDLEVLLAVPLHLALSASETSAEMLRDPVIIYESLQQVAARMRIYVQRGAMHAPNKGRMLFSLLEASIFEVEAPRGGVFHPKLWALRFVDDAGNLFFRLIVSSRNITADRSWDLALVLEGKPGESAVPDNASLAKLVRQLPALCPAGEDAQVERLASELHKIRWVLPHGFSRARFHLLGIGNKTWRPRRNEALLVISPFVSDTALKDLAATSESPLALISRSESLADLAKPAPFDEAYCLHEAAETDDGDEEEAQPDIGLHAKAYIYKSGKYVYVTLGSANATNAALVAGHNVELLVELRGGTPQLGGPIRLLDMDNGSLGQLLMPWQRDENHTPNAEAKATAQQLEDARRALASHDLALHCRAQNNQWHLVLVPTDAIDLDQVDEIQAWPVSLKRAAAVNAGALARGEEVVMPVQDLVSVTSLVAFSLRIGTETTAFTLNLPIEGMPEEREGALLQQVVSTTDGFLRYLLMLLAGIGDGANLGSVAIRLISTTSARFCTRPDHYPLLEDMIRAYCREPERLDRIRVMVQRLSGEQEGESVLPAGFLEFWQAFDEAIGEDDSVAEK